MKFKSLLSEAIDKYEILCDRSIVPIVVLLIICQIMDGILTYIGITKFGIWREGNPLLRYLMGVYPPYLVLILVKSIAIILLSLIKVAYGSLSRSMLFIMPCLYVILMVYVFRAIIPWIWVIFF